MGVKYKLTVEDGNNLLFILKRDGKTVYHGGRISPCLDIMYHDKKFAFECILEHIRADTKTRAILEKIIK